MTGVIRHKMLFTNDDIILKAKQKIDWVICGGESGKNARPMHPDWVRSLQTQCAEAEVPFFFKQWGEWLPWEHNAQAPFMDSQNGQFVDSHGLDILNENSEPNKNWFMDYETQMLCERVGKRKSGCLLDGVKYKEFPNRNAKG